MSPERHAPPPLLLTLLLLLGALACRPGVPPSTEIASPAALFEDPRWASVVQQAREELIEQRGVRGWRAPSRKLLLAPLAGERAPAAASALSWWLLRFEAGLLPQESSAELRSVAALQAFSRRNSGPVSQYWTFDLVGVEPARFELVVVQDGSVARSREFTVWQSPIEPLWPLDRAAALARLEGVAARSIVREDGRVFVDTGEGQGELVLRRGVLRMRDVGGPVPRWQPLPPLPSLEILREDARLIWSQRLRASGECVEGWSVTRQGASLALPLRRPCSSALRILTGLATTEGERWLLFRDDGDVELHAPTMRVASGARSLRHASPRPIRVERPAPSPSKRDPLTVWSDAANRAPLRRSAHLLDDDAARWECADAGQAAEIVVALRARVEQLMAQRAWSWLVEPLRPLRLRSKGRVVEFVGENLPPDLRQRLDHPLLWIPLPADGAEPGHASPWRWGEGGKPSALRCAWPDAIGDGAAPSHGGESVAVGIVSSAAAPAAARMRLAELLGGRGIEEIFALEAPEWEARGPVSGRPWSDFATPRAAEAVPPFQLMLQVDPTILDAAERERLLRRMEVLLREDGFAMSVVPTGEIPRVGGSTVVARLTRLALYSEEALLRALELGSWCGLDVPSADVRNALALAPHDPRRVRIAEAMERELIESAAFIVLWRERWSCRADGRLLDLPSWNPRLPPPPSDLRWHPAASFAPDGPSESTLRSGGGA